MTRVADKPAFSFGSLNAQPFSFGSLLKKEEPPRAAEPVESKEVVGKPFIFAPSTDKPSSGGFNVSVDAFKSAMSSGGPGFVFQSAKPPPTIDTAETSRLNKIKGLNASLSQHLKQAIDKDPFANMSGILRAYNKHHTSIQ
jgi:hypothetical protein